MHDRISSVGSIPEENKHQTKVCNSLNLLFAGRKIHQIMFFKKFVIDYHLVLLSEEFYPVYTEVNVEEKSKKS